MKHLHSELMADYAADAAVTAKPWELWEFRDKGLANWPDEWMTLERNPSWQLNTEYRRKASPSYLTGKNHALAHEGTTGYKPGKRKLAGQAFRDYNRGYADGMRVRHDFKIQKIQRESKNHVSN